MSKKVLIHSLIFSPDGVSTAYLYNDIALRFQKEGYEVVVLSTTPHFNVVEEQLAKQPLKWKIPGIYKESDFHGIKVMHVPQKKFKSTALRILEMCIRDRYLALPMDVLLIGNGIRGVV